MPAGAAGATTASFVIRGGQAVIEAQLQALASKDRARILSAPKLVTLDNITARITRSQNIYVQVDTVSPAGGYGGVGLQEIQTGLTLEITPSIVPAQSDRDQSLVRLNLRAENSAPGSGSFGQIDVNSQEVQTNVLVPDSDTFVIGGLFDDSNINSESGVPYLKDIPILGALFRDTKSQKSLGETIFFITPRIVDERSVLQSDIAVKEGSSEYIRRARAELSAVSDERQPEDRHDAPARKPSKKMSDGLEQDKPDDRSPCLSFWPSWSRWLGVSCRTFATRWCSSPGARRAEAAVMQMAARERALRNGQGPFRRLRTAEPQAHATRRWAWTAGLAVGGFSVRRQPDARQTACACGPCRAARPVQDLKVGAADVCRRTGADRRHEPQRMGIHERICACCLPGWLCLLC